MKHLNDILTESILDNDIESRMDDLIPIHEAFKNTKIQLGRGEIKFSDFIQYVTLDGYAINIDVHDFDVLAIEIDTSKCKFHAGYYIDNVILSNGGRVHLEIINSKNDDITPWVPRHTWVGKKNYSFGSVFVAMKRYKSPDITFTHPFECSEFIMRLSNRIDDRPDIWFQKDTLFFDAEFRGVRSLHNLPTQLNMLDVQTSVLSNMLKDRFLLPSGCKVLTLTS